MPFLYVLCQKLEVLSDVFVCERDDYDVDGCDNNPLVKDSVDLSLLKSQSSPLLLPKIHIRDRWWIEIQRSINHLYVYLSDKESQYKGYILLLEKIYFWLKKMPLLQLV